jgi:hypothetical protein
VPISQNSTIPVKQQACSASVCLANQSFLQKLQAFYNQSALAQGITWQITEAYPPTVPHQNACHSLGTCVDINFIGTAGSPAHIISMTNIGNANNLKLVYEVQTQAAYNALHPHYVQAGLCPSSGQCQYLSVQPQITAAHFSVY